MPSLTTSSPGPGPEELRYGDVALSASSAASSAQVSPNAAAKQNAAEPESEQRHDDCASDAESERRDESTGLGGGGGGDGSVAETAPMPPTSVGVMPTMMPGTVMYPEWGDEYLVNGGYSVSPTAYMSMGYANGAAQRRQTPTSNIAPGSPSPGGGLLSPSKAVAYNPWPAMQQQSTWSPPGGPHLGLPIWNQAHLQQQQRGRAMPSMSPSSPMTQNSYALAAAARGKYSTPPGIPASTAGMAPYAAAAAAVVQNSTKWPSYQTDRGLMGSAPGTGGPGNATGLDNMASLDHCLSDIMRNDGAMQNHYRGYMNPGSMSAQMNQYSGRSMGFLDDSGVILDDGSGMGGMDGNGMATGFSMMLGGTGGGHGSASMGHPHMGHHHHPHTHHGAYQQHHHAHHQPMHPVGQGNSGMSSSQHLGTVGPFPSRPSPSADGVPGQERYSRKVFVGGLPPDIDEEEITASFRRFGALIVDWPHKAESKSYFPPKGYAFLLFQEESSVQALIDACIQDDDKLYLCVSSPTIKDKPVQIRPWRLTDADYVLDASMPLDPRKTVFVGGVPRPLKAVELATIMDRLYGGVCYAGIDTDPELKYPKGAGRVAFSNQQSYIAAISARFVQLQHGDIDKRVEVKPYVLDDQMCDECGGQRCGGKFAPFFCANVTCLQYYCDSCWLTIHSRPGREYHKPLVKEGADRPRTLSSYHHRWC